MSIFKYKPEITGDKIILRPVQTADVDSLQQLLLDREVNILTGSVHSSDAEIESYETNKLKKLYGDWAVSDERTVFMIVRKSDGEIIGESVLNDYDAGNSSCNFRIWIAGVTGHGFGTETVNLTMTYAFRDLNLHRVELEVYDFNPRARHVYEKAGFKHEGTKRDALRFDGQWVDAHTMSMLNREWHMYTN
ncbi:GNAT family N-acetyltransferase [Virgibacillus siamensis]|uniref:GNAT family N-acetyltransferase n=1 Tax=Virgibacillus siamensis TaxID=480071 RepID=UPI001C377833|nr:GNAT family protein [Virgibacillus siamensis]